MELYFTKTGALFNWMKLPVYSFACIGCTAYRFFLTHICAPFLNEATLNLKTKKIKIYEAHLEYKITTDYYTFRKYLIQPTTNLPKAKVIKQERDLKKAAECVETIKQSLDDILQAATKNELKTLAKKLNLSDSSKEDISQALMAKIPDAEKLQTQFSGVCGMMLAKFAADRFANKSWQEIARKASHGASAKTSGMQIVYEALEFSNRSEFVGTLKGVYAKPVDAKDIDDAANLQSGVYKISFKTTTARHAILLSKEGDRDYIIDPNIGLLECSHLKTEKLLKKIISKTTKLEDIDFKFFKYEQISVEEGLKKALLAAK